MKKILVCLFSVLLIPFTFLNASAAEAECSLKLPKEYTVASQSDKLDTLADIFGIKTASLEDYYKENNVLYLAANKENTCQVTLCAVKNEFSEGAVSFSRLSQTELETVAADLAGESFENLGLTEGSDGNRYIILRKKLSDRGGEYTVTEYITVCSYKLYTLSVSVADGADADDLPQTALNGLEITDLACPQSSEKGFAFTALAAVGIAVFAAVAVYFTVTVIRDIKRSKEQSEDR